jgi:hypothetical protein
MSQAGTFLDDLDKGHPDSGDTDLVKQIFDSMNEPSSSNPVHSMPSSRAPMINAQQQLPNTLQTTADPSIPTAHMIGREHPTSADFQQMIMNSDPVAFNSHGPGSSIGQSVSSMNVPTPYIQDTPKMNWQGKMIDELKQPILIAIIVFVITLPALNLLVAHYLPSLLKSTGEFTMLGMLARSLLAGGLFWFCQNIVGPLVSF